jgi:2-iminobutanoate/2-iminopropanoate deaminase
MDNRNPVRENTQPDALFRRTVGGHLLYSHVVTAQGGKLVFISGQLARDRDGNIVGQGDMAAQIRQVGENIKSALEAAGAGLGDLISTTTYVTDIDAFFECVDVRMEYFGPGLPTSTTVEVRRLSHPDFMVEVQAVALIS